MKEFRDGPDVSGNGPERREDIIFGRNPVMEYLRAGKPVDKLYVLRGEREGSILKIMALARERRITVAETDRRRLFLLTGTESHQGVAASVTVKDYCGIPDILAAAAEKGRPPVIVICENINDPHNLGAIIRSAAASGADGMIIPKRNSVSVNSVVYKTSAGAAAFFPVARVTNIAAAIDELKKAGVWIYGTAAEGASDYSKTDLTGPAAFVIGGEGEGLKRLTRDKCDILVKIPIEPQVESLNASVAAAVVLFEARRQREEKNRD